MQSPGPDPAKEAAPEVPDNALPDGPVPGTAVPDDTVPDEAPPDDAAHGAPVWRFLISPRWILWHFTAFLGAAGMLWLGNWQFHRAISGNGLSWAYTFEWPLFAGFAVVFWGKTIRDEFRIRRAALDPNLAVAGVDPGVQLPAGLGTEQAGTYVGGAPDEARWTGAGGSEPVLASAWRADMIRAAAEWAADPELAEYNMRLARLSAKHSAKSAANGGAGGSRGGSGGSRGGAGGSKGGAGGSKGGAGGSKSRANGDASDAQDQAPRQ